MIGIGDIIAVGTLCMQIYDRCKGSRGEFKLLSIKAFHLHRSLKTVEDGWRAQNLSGEHRVQLQGLVSSISELLRELESRLLKYQSLGREMPGSISDQIGWALKGGGTDFEKRLDSHINMMILFLNRSVHNFESLKTWSATYVLLASTMHGRIQWGEMSLDQHHRGPTALMLLFIMIISKI